MIFKINSSYKICIKIGDALLTYTGLITQEDEMFFSFTDKYNEEFTYNKSVIISKKENK